MQKQTKWLIGLIAALVAINIALVATIWLKKNEQANVASPNNKSDARDYLVERLSLNELQVKAFDSLRHEHFERMDEYKTSMLFIKARLFSLLQEKDTNRIKTQIKTYLREKIGELQADADVETFEHFRQLRNLLNEEQKEQKEKFDSIIQDVIGTLKPNSGQ